MMKEEGMRTTVLKRRLFGAIQVRVRPGAKPSAVFLLHR